MVWLMLIITTRRKLFPEACSLSQPARLNVYQIVVDYREFDAFVERNIEKKVPVFLFTIQNPNRKNLTSSISSIISKGLVHFPMESAEGWRKNSNFILLLLFQIY